MKVIKYCYNQQSVELQWSEVNELLAKEEADGGVYTIEDNGCDTLPLTLEERVRSLEKAVVPGNYTPGTWYYRGDKVSFQGAVYTCTAPDGVVCVWSPAEYPVYWEKN